MDGGENHERLQTRETGRTVLFVCSIKTKISVGLFSAITIFLALSATIAGALDAAPAPKLRFAVILTRHGVRSPTWTLQDLNAYSSEPWPNWGVPPGNLTPRGNKLMTLFGSYYRLYFADAGLLRSYGCEDAVYVYFLADAESRTRETASAMAAGMMPGCSLTVHSVRDKKDPLFSPLSAGIAKPDRALAAASISGRIGGNPNASTGVYRHSSACYARCSSVVLQTQRVQRSKNLVNDRFLISLPRLKPGKVIMPLMCEVRSELVQLCRRIFCSSTLTGWTAKISAGAGWMPAS